MGRRITLLARALNARPAVRLAVHALQLEPRWPNLLHPVHNAADHGGFWDPYRACYMRPPLAGRPGEDLVVRRARAQGAGRLWIEGRAPAAQALAQLTKPHLVRVQFLLDSVAPHVHDSQAGIALNQLILIRLLVGVAYGTPVRREVDVHRLKVQALWALGDGLPPVPDPLHLGSHFLGLVLLERLPPIFVQGRVVLEPLHPRQLLNGVLNPRDAVAKEFVSRVNLPLDDSVLLEELPGLWGRPLREGDRFPSIAALGGNSKRGPATLLSLLPLYRARYLHLLPCRRLDGPFRSKPERKDVLLVVEPRVPCLDGSDVLDQEVLPDREVLGQGFVLAGSPLSLPRLCGVLLFLLVQDRIVVRRNHLVRNLVMGQVPLRLRHRPPEPGALVLEMKVDLHSSVPRPNVVRLRGMPASVGLARIGRHLSPQLGTRDGPNGLSVLVGAKKLKAHRFLRLQLLGTALLEFLPGDDPGGPRGIPLHLGPDNVALLRQQGASLRGAPDEAGSQRLPRPQLEPHPVGAQNQRRRASDHKHAFHNPLLSHRPPSLTSPCRSSTSPRCRPRTRPCSGSQPPPRTPSPFPSTTQSPEATKLSPSCRSDLPEPLSHPPLPPPEGNPSEGG
mmetsp:Transcript_8554/g.24454  ORF Transcript_8554/g.24454 Transcript_8554/m.24454 type:complete len:617 (-) Transcript_8554:318-2168(-)